VKDDATINDNDMSSQGNLGRFIQDQFQALREDVRDDINLIRDDVREVKGNVEKLSDGIDDINTQLGGREGIRERLTALEVQMGQALTNSSLSTYPPPPVKRKKSIKDHAPALGAGAGATGLLYMLVELANTFLKTK
jgi:hypothetical protein